MNSPIRVTAVSARMADDRAAVIATLGADDGRELLLELSPGVLGELIANLTRLDRIIIGETDAADGGPEGPS